jgi:Tfp pilus assembly protein PilF
MRRHPFQTTLLIALLATGCASTPQKKRQAQHQKKKLQLEALQQYRLGIDSYSDDRYAEAIQAWKKTLEIDPNYPNAKEYIERAEKVEKTYHSIKKTPSSRPQPVSATASTTATATAR